MRNIPRMKPVEKRSDDSAKTEWNNVGNAHIFAAMHYLNGGDVQPLTQY